MKRFAKLFFLFCVIGIIIALLMFPWNLYTDEGRKRNWDRNPNAVYQVDVILSGQFSLLTKTFNMPIVFAGDYDYDGTY